MDERALVAVLGVVAASRVVVERGVGTAGAPEAQNTLRVVFRSAGPPKPVEMPRFGGG